jgi:hypothetical protein
MAVASLMDHPKCSVRSFARLCASSLGIELTASANGEIAPTPSIATFSRN